MLENIDREGWSVDSDVEKDDCRLINILQHCNQSSEVVCVTSESGISPETKDLLQKRREVKQTFNNNVQLTVFSAVREKNRALTKKEETKLAVAQRAMKEDAWNFTP